ncbi:unnamed protein product [Clavelina lepadiformis]|uniref:TIP41-like protein n=1 Tax=Clavelina lepadiformis TaxID=159417 RepID=A0ABP0EYA5_CLALP
MALLASTAAHVGEICEPFTLGQWKFIAHKNHILNSQEVEALCKNLEIPQIPEMTFGHNKLQITHAQGFQIEFNATDSLQRVDNKHDLMKVAVAKEWNESRKNNEFIKETVKPFDWTFTTDYKGTVNDPQNIVKVLETTERINVQRLKMKEKILYFEEMTLFEDELADNGCAQLTVKIRVMPSCFFLLMRFYLRVDGVLSRIHDTRWYHEFGTNHLIREYTEKEKAIKEMRHISPAVLTDANAMDQILDLKQEIFEKVVFGNTDKQSLDSRESNSKYMHTALPTDTSASGS